MTALQAGRPYMSIGEVLNVLKEEFPDVTVSKIRFLESEGLVHPERTPSGYRKFSAMDVERLRFVLRQQRDHFLPLKVIRERLAEWEAAGDHGGQLNFDQAPADQAAAEESPAPEQAPLLAPDPLTPSRTIAMGLSMSREEFVRATGLSDREIKDLRTYGLLDGDEADRYDETDLEVAKLARDLFKLGLEPRHLRMFRSTVDRWATLAEQMVLPLVKQRNPEARRAASETVRELVRVGNKLTQTLLREALAPYA